MSTLSLSAIALIVCAFCRCHCTGAGGQQCRVSTPSGSSVMGQSCIIINQYYCFSTVIINFKVPKPVLSADLLHQPFWIWLGGIAGMLYLTSALIPVPKIGGITFS